MTLSAIFTSCGLDTSKKGTSASTLKTKVENVKIKKEHSNAWAVTGMIRNESSVNIKGAVKIKFLNSKGDVVHNNRAKLMEVTQLIQGRLEISNILLIQIILTMLMTLTLNSMKDKKK